jgi:hypothetical protein
MFSSNRTCVRWFLIALSLIILPIENALCAPQAFVHVALEWGSPNKTVYTYVFSGLITCQNKPCANARVAVDLVTPTEGVISLAGSPEDSSSWKIAAHTASVSDQASAEAEGRIILMEDQKTVVVDRSLLLIQA